LNHAKHLALPLAPMETLARKEWLKDAGRDHMICADCHEPDASRRYMQPIRYAKHCAKCHALEAEKGAGLANAPLPHGVPARVLVEHVKALGIEAEIQKTLETYIAAHPDELKAEAPKGPKGPRGPGQPKPPEPKQVTPEEWVEKKMRDWRGADGEKGVTKIVDDVLHAEAKNGCAKCHKLEGAEDAPAIVPTRVPARWFQNSMFNHEKHRVVSCAQCHPKAKDSTLTSDVLLPSIESCRNCHKTGGASSNCTLCHLYHDRGSDRRD